METSITIDAALQAPVVLSLSFPSIGQQLELESNPPQLTLTLSFGTIVHRVNGYTLNSHSYERTCLNDKCIKYKTPLPGSNNCPACKRRTQEVELSQTIKNVTFPSAYTVKFESPLLSLSFNNAALAQIEGFARDTKVTLQDKLDSIKDYQTLWTHPSHYVALHTIGHQLMKALPLSVLHAEQDLNFICSNNPRNPSGTWFDTSDGGNGATESILQYWNTLVPAALELTQACDCQTGCPKCLSDFRCPDRNEGLLKQMGQFILKGLI